MHQLETTPVLEVKDLEISYSTRKGLVRAVRGVSFEIWPGDPLGLVGKSGCGKSTLAFAIMNYMATNGKVPGGRILFYGEDILQKNERELHEIRGNKFEALLSDNGKEYPYHTKSGREKHTFEKRCKKLGIKH